jgi:hypothetical protein
MSAPVEAGARRISQSLAPRRLLKGERFPDRCRQPCVKLVRLKQFQHGLGMDRSHDIVHGGRQERVKQVLALGRRSLRSSSASPRSPDPENPSRWPRSG